jgi:tetratricopeptide (TPR) repeat protein
MSSQPVPQPKSKLAGDDRNVVAAGSGEVALTFDERVQLWWHEYRSTILITCVALLAVFVGKELVVIFLQRRERAVAEAFDAAGTNPTLLRSFANANPDYGLAWLALADAAMKTESYSEAKGYFDKALSKLAGTPFAGRAQLGAALSQVLGGDKAKGEELLKKMVDDPKQMKAYRAEASLDLAVLAREAGRIEEARSLLTGIFQFDLQGAMSQRVFAEMSSLPPENKPAAEAATPAASELKLSLPAKP